MLTERQAKRNKAKQSRAQQEKEEDTWCESLAVHVTHGKINHPAMAP